MLKIICGIALVAAMPVPVGTQQPPPCVPSSRQVVAQTMPPCVFLMGRIDQPGIHRYETGMTARHLIDKAGGTAAASRLVIWRVVNGQRVQLDATLDTPLQPNDAVEIEVVPGEAPIAPRMPTQALMNLLRERGLTR